MDNKFFVSFDIANKLKDIGFPQKDSDWFYDEEKEEIISNAFADPRYWSDYRYKYIIAAPTYHEVIDWLEKKHGILISTETDEVESYFCCLYNKRSVGPLYISLWFSSREEALNAAITEALKLI